MPVVYRGANWTINIYADDHGLPHFHVRTPDSEVVIAISSLAVLVGHVSPKVLSEVRGWAAQHQDLLMAKWRELNG